MDTPGIELTVKFERPDHPLAYGYPEITSAFRTDLPTYAVRPRDQRFVVLQWGTSCRRTTRPTPRRPPRRRDKDKPKEATPPFVVSGGSQEGRRPRGPAGDPRLPSGKGRVLAFNFDPMHRDLNHSDYRFLWNGILNWNGLPPAQP